MKLLVVTDHRFYKTPRGVMDNYCFDRSFFAEYRRVFDQVRVAARLRSDQPPAEARRADGDGVSFTGLADVQGGRWAVAPRRLYCGALDEAVAWADAVCVRIPSISGFHAFRLARWHRKPVMFEMLGDPLEAVQGREQGCLARGFGIVLAGMTLYITRNAAVGSYVSYRHLQRRYPTRPGTRHDSISSIRLAASDICPARTFVRAPSPLEIVLIASLMPVKDHSTLIRGVARAITQGAAVRLHLAGDGPLRASLEALTRALGLSEHVIFYGHVSSRERLSELLDSAHLCAMTSISEGMPRAMIEAMARGLPAIGTSAGGIAEILTPAQLVPAGDAGRLGDLIAKLSRSPELLTAFAAHSHKVAQDFRDDILSQRRQRLLAELRDRACPPSRSR